MIFDFTLNLTIILLFKKPCFIFMLGESTLQWPLWGTFGFNIIIHVEYNWFKNMVDLIFGINFGFWTLQLFLFLFLNHDF
jgi:hypothetical protein